MPEILDIEEVRSAHHDGSAEKKYHRSFGGTYIKDLVYGANDGIVTTFAVVAGVAGAHLEPSVIVILGFANLIGDGISMAIGNYLGTKSEIHYQRRQRKMEEWEVDHLPEEEREEVRDIYRRKGFSGNILEQAVGIITANKKRWVDDMMTHELGIFDEGSDPWKAVKNGAATFVAFMIAGFLPLVPFVFGVSSNNLMFSACMTGVALFVVGGARSIITRHFWLKSGLEVLIVGAIAASAAYAVGAYIGRFIPHLPEYTTALLRG